MAGGRRCGRLGGLRRRRPEPTTPAPTGRGRRSVEQVNHLATHNLFTAACETFLAAYARVVDEAGRPLRGELRGAGPRAALRAVPGVPEAARARPRRGEHAHRQAPRLLLPRGAAARASARPSRARPTCWSSWPSTSTRTCSPRARCSRPARTPPAPTPTSPSTATSSPTRRAVAELKQLYRHPADRAASLQTAAASSPRPAATPVGRVLAPVRRGGLRGRPARSRSTCRRREVGFAIASHHLWMAEGTRTVDVGLEAQPSPRRAQAGARRSSTCGAGSRRQGLDREAGRLAVGRTRSAGSSSRSASTATTRRSRPTTLPSTGTPSPPPCRCCWCTLPAPGQARRGTTPALESIDAERTSPLAVDVKGLKTRHALQRPRPVDGSKPFLAFGSTPTANSSLVIGSKEVFQKAPTQRGGRRHVDDRRPSRPRRPPSGDRPTYLANGTWTTPADLGEAVAEPHYTLTGIPSAPPVDPRT